MRCKTKEVQNQSQIDDYLRKGPVQLGPCIGTLNVSIRQYGSYSGIHHSLGFTRDHIVRKVKEELFN